MDDEIEEAYKRFKRASIELFVGMTIIVIEFIGIWIYLEKFYK